MQNLQLLLPDKPVPEHILVKQEAKTPKQMIPWGAENLDEFLFYCCPECDDKFKESQSFLDHAMHNHENSNLEMETMPMEIQDELKYEVTSMGTPHENSNLAMETTPIVVSSAIPLRFPGLIPVTVKQEDDFVSNESRIDPLSCEMDGVKQEQKQEEIFKCEVCWKTFKTKVGLQKHIRLTHENVVETFQCDQCDAKYNDKGVLLKHIKKAHVFSTTKCDKCDFVGNNINEIKAHRHTHRFTKLPDDRYQCKECEEILKPDAKLHLHIHFQCDICSFTCVGIQADMDWHKIRVHNSTFDCDQCEAKFAKRKELTSHVKEAHPTIPASLKCDKCDYVSKNQVEKRIHMHTHRFTKLTDDTYQCNVCDKIVKPGKKKTSRLSAHNHYNCDLCSFTTTRPCMLTEHKKVKHDGVPITYRYMCDKCDFMTWKSGTLKKHQESVHEEKTEMCYLCGKDFKNLRRHIKTTHEDQGMTVTCHICHKTMKPYVLQQHMEKYHEHYICTICNKILTAKRNLCDHYFKEHEVVSVPGEKFACHVCKKAYKTMEEIQRHLKEEHKILDEHPCTDCEMKFSTKALLAIHLMDTHDFKEEDAAIFLGTVSKVVKSFSESESDSFKFQCDVCQAKLKTINSLVRHKRQIHEKHNHNVKCDQCDFVTTEPNRLKRHFLQNHVKATKYPCDQCSYVTNILSSLKHHMKFTHEKRCDHSCTVCQKKFPSKKRMADHMLLQHNIVFKFKIGQ